jgi:cytochrome c556
MRIVPIAFVASIAVLAACGAASTSQANNAQATMNNTAVPVATSAASLVTARVTGRAAAQIMHERHEGMETIGKASKAIHDQLQASSPDVGVIRSSAAKIADFSQKASGWFHAGTGPDVAKTGAKPEIWQNPQDFSAKLATFQGAAKAFEEAANGGDISAIKAKVGPLGEACKACHDKYRSKMQH